MSSNIKTCYGCKTNLPKKEFLICTTCKQGYDLLCANLSSKHFYLMDIDCKNKWSCHECLSKLPKKDNSNTPVRSTNRAATSEVECLENLDENNITMRTKHPRSKSASDSYVTEEKMRQIIKQEMTETITSLVSEHLANLNRQISGFQESLSFISKQYDDLLQSVNKKNDIINSLVSKTEKLSSQLKSVTDRIVQVEQNMRVTNIEINGIPEHKSENLLRTVEQLGRIVQSPIAPNDILHVSRVAKINKESSRPRSVIVKLRSQLRRDELLVAVSRFNKKNKDNKLSTEHLGIGGSRSPVFVSEHLTLTNKQLHAAARKKAKEAGFKFVWIRDGRIFTRKSEQSHVIYLKDEDSLKLIV